MPTNFLHAAGWMASEMPRTISSHLSGFSMEEVKKVMGQYVWEA